MVERIKIGGSYYKVEKQKDLTKNEQISAQIRYLDKKILIQEELEEQYANEVIIHEMIHGMLYMMNEEDKNNNEKIVDRIAQGLYMILIDNKELFKKMLETDYEN